MLGQLQGALGIIRTQARGRESQSEVAARPRRQVRGIRPFPLESGDVGLVDSTVGFAAVSATKPIGNYASSPTGNYFVPKTGDAQKEAVAADFITFVSGEGYQAYVDEAGIIPVLSSATTPPLSGLWQQVATILETATPAYNAALPGFSALTTEVNKLLAGQAAPQQTADSLNTILEQAKAAGISETTMTKITNGIPVRASSMRKVREVLGIAPLTTAQAEAGYPPDVQLARDAIGMMLMDVPEEDRAEKVRDLFRAMVNMKRDD